jgi:hypothetical protein
MKVICRIGRFVGEVRNYPPEVAKQMLADGRADPINGPARKTRPRQAAAEVPGLPPWTSKMPPRHYLKLHPSGKSADLARRHLEAQPT